MILAFISGEDFRDGSRGVCVGGAWETHAPPSLWTEQALNAEVYRALSACIATPTQRTSLYESLLRVLQT